MSARTTLDAWIARDAIPFSIDSPVSIDGAVDRIIGSLGDSVELLGLGEALHGSEEILLLRNRLFQRLLDLVLGYLDSVDNASAIRLLLGLIQPPSRSDVHWSWPPAGVAFWNAFRSCRPAGRALHAPAGRPARRAGAARNGTARPRAQLPDYRPPGR